MTFYKLDDVPVRREDQVFKESPVLTAFWAVLFFGIAGGALFLGITKWHPSAGSMSPDALYFIAGVFALIGLIPLAMFRASLKPSNWLLRCQLSGFILKYRGFENWKLPADKPQAVGFDYGEIAWAKLVKEHRKAISSDGKGGTETTFLTYIDLGLINPDTTELEANLQAERNLHPDGRMVVLDYPVQVLPNGIVEIRWGSGIRPSAKKAMAVVGQRVKVLDTEHRNTDLTYRRGANPEEQKAKILALAKNGHEMAATKLAQMAYGYDMTQATHFVDSLMGRKDA